MKLVAAEQLACEAYNFHSMRTTREGNCHENCSIPREATKRMGSFNLFESRAFSVLVRKRHEPLVSPGKMNALKGGVVLRVIRFEHLSGTYLCRHFAVHAVCVFVFRCNILTVPRRYSYNGFLVLDFLSFYFFLSHAYAIQYVDRH